MSYILTAGDKAVIRQIVNRLHVSEPDMEVIQVVESKLKNPSPSQLRAALREAVAQHRRNQQLHKRVMRGGF